MNSFKDLLLGIFLLSSVTPASAAVLTCTMERLKEPRKDIVSVKLSAANQVSSLGLDVGQDNYNFTLEVKEIDAGYNIDVTFYENNSVQDEVGGHNCKYDPKTGTRVFCEEFLSNDEGKDIIKFYCRISDKK